LFEIFKKDNRIKYMIEYETGYVVDVTRFFDEAGEWKHKNFLMDTNPDRRKEILNGFAHYCYQFNLFWLKDEPGWSQAEKQSLLAERRKMWDQWIYVPEFQKYTYKETNKIVNKSKNLVQFLQPQANGFFSEYMFFVAYGLNHSEQIQRPIHFNYSRNKKYIDLRVKVHEPYLRYENWDLKFCGDSYDTPNRIENPFSNIPNLDKIVFSHHGIDPMKGGTKACSGPQVIFGALSRWPEYALKEEHKIAIKRLYYQCRCLGIDEKTCFEYIHKIVLGYTPTKTETNIYRDFFEPVWFESPKFVQWKDGILDRFIHGTKQKDGTIWPTNIRYKILTEEDTMKIMTHNKRRKKVLEGWIKKHQTTLPNVVLNEHSANKPKIQL
jgi:hypothetical protein